VVRIPQTASVSRSETARYPSETAQHHSETAQYPSETAPEQKYQIFALVESQVKFMGLILTAGASSIGPFWASEASQIHEQTCLLDTPMVQIEYCSVSFVVVVVSIIPDRQITIKTRR
jgi:hypothetical protein